jgi:hypothetical protein
MRNRLLRLFSAALLVSLALGTAGCPWRRGGERREERREERDEHHEHHDDDRH